MNTHDLGLMSSDTQIVSNEVYPTSLLQDYTPVATPGTSPLKSGRTTVNISTAFHPSLSTDLGLPNIVLVSTDEVHFYIHAQRILQKSTNRMDALIPSDVGQIIQSGQVVVTTGDTAAVLNVILHAIYEWPCTTFAPTFDSIEAATARLETYGVSLKDCLAPEKPLRVLLLNHTSIRPMEIYAMAAFNGLEEFAVVVSSHLLAYRLTTLSDELAVRMGARYLYRLAVLHHNRMEKLKKLVLSAPDVHATTDTCSFMQQKDLTGVWALASAHLSWEATPDTPTSIIQNVMGAVEGQSTCALCKDAVKSRVKQIVYEWTLAERTI